MTDVSTAHFHDAELVALEVMRIEQTLKLKFRWVEGVFENLIFTGVKTFRVSDFIIQNVVSRILLSSKNDFPPDRLKYWIEWANSLTDGSFMGAGDVLKYEELINSRKLELFVIEPSFGSECAVICEDIRLSSHA